MVRTFAAILAGSAILFTIMSCCCAWSFAARADGEVALRGLNTRAGQSFPEERDSAEVGKGIGAQENDRGTGIVHHVYVPDRVFGMALLIAIVVSPLLSVHMLNRVLRHQTEQMRLMRISTNDNLCRTYAGHIDDPSGRDLFLKLHTLLEDIRKELKEARSPARSPHEAASVGPAEGSPEQPGERMTIPAVGSFFEKKQCDSIFGNTWPPSISENLLKRVWMEKGAQQREEFEAAAQQVIGDPLEFHLAANDGEEWIVLAVRRRDGGSWTLIPRKGWNFWKGNRCDESYFDGFFIGHEEYKKGRNLRVAVVDKFGKATLRDGVLAVSEKGMISPGVQPEKVCGGAL